MAHCVLLLVSVGLLPRIRAASYPDFQEVLCSAPECETMGNSAMLKDGRNISCSVVLIPDDKIPRINSSSETSDRPDFADVTCYQIFSERIKKYKAALSVSWGHQENYIRSGLVKAYYLDFDMQTFGVTLNIDGETKGSEIDVPQYIKFTYNCYGKNGFLKGGKKIPILVRPVPRSKRYESSNTWSISYPVPDVLKCRKPNYETTTPESYDSTIADYLNPTYQSSVASGTNQIFIIVVAGLIVMLMLGTAVIYKKCKGCKSAEDDTPDTEERLCLINPSSSILILADSKNTQDCDKAHKVAMGIRNSYDVKVVCNFENKKSIIYQQKLVPWYCQQLSNADTVIFVNGMEVLRQIDDGNIQKGTTNEFESFLKIHFEDYRREEKKTIFLEDDAANIDYIIKQYPAKCRRFLYRDSYSKEDPFYKELFSAQRQDLHAGNGKQKNNGSVKKHPNLDSANDEVAWQEFSVSTV